MEDKIKKFEIIRNHSDSRMLNLPGNHSKAGVSWFVKSDINIKASTHPYIDVDIDAELLITDCFKGVTLDFHISDGRNYDVADKFKNSLYKLDRLTESIQELKMHIAQSYEDYMVLKEVMKDYPKEDYYEVVPLEDVLEQSKILKKEQDAIEQSENKEAAIQTQN